MRFTSKKRAREPEDPGMRLTQSLIALSSAESKLYALVKCVSELLGIRSALKDWCSNVGGVVKTDASAALGIIQRQGLGKVRHIGAALLYVQNLACSKDSGLWVKVPDTANPADMCTKGLTQDKIHKYLSVVNMRFRDGRADAATKLQGS